MGLSGVYGCLCLIRPERTDVTACRKTYACRGKSDGLLQDTALSCSNSALTLLCS